MKNVNRILEKVGPKKAPEKKEVRTPTKVWTVVDCYVWNSEAYRVEGLSKKQWENETHRDVFLDGKMVGILYRANTKIPTFEVRCGMYRAPGGLSGPITQPTFVWTMGTWDYATSYSFEAHLALLKQLERSTREMLSATDPIDNVAKIR
jgi:hypothetical protein